MATHQQDQLTVVNPTDESFTVKWAGNPYTLTAHQQLIWPRFLAEHFAKHLTDSILLKREEKARLEYKKSGRPMSEYIPPALLNSRRERPKVVDSIIKGVYTYYMQQGASGQGAEIQRQIDDWNKPQATPAPPQTQSREQNMGSAADPLLGELNDDDDEEEPQTTPTLPINSPSSIQDAVTQALGTTQPTEQPVAPTVPVNGLQRRNGLIQEAKQLGIKVNPSMTTEMLEDAIKKQYA